MPRGIAKGYRYALTAIAVALALWGAGMAGAAVRSMLSTAMAIGASSGTRWASVRRWVLSAAELFGAAISEAGPRRARAARIAAFVASRAPVPVGPVVLDAFSGAAFCASG